jgi:hypothetical protein
MDLPPPGTMRWTAWQKVAVIRAIRDGALTPAEAQTRYMLSEEELAGWQNDFDRGGIAGLQQKSLRRRRRRQHHE